MAEERRRPIGGAPHVWLNAAAPRTGTPDQLIKSAMTSTSHLIITRKHSRIGTVRDMEAERKN